MRPSARCSPWTGTPRLPPKVDHHHGKALCLPSSCKEERVTGEGSYSQAPSLGPLELCPGAFRGHPATEWKDSCFSTCYNLDPFRHPGACLQVMGCCSLQGKSALLQRPQLPIVVLRAWTVCGSLFSHMAPVAVPALAHQQRQGSRKRKRWGGVQAGLGDQALDSPPCRAGRAAMPSGCELATRHQAL